MSRPAPPSPPPQWSKHLYVRIPRQEIVYFKFLLECEHNLALMTVVDKYQAVLRLIFSPDQAEEVDAFLVRIGEEVPVQRLAVPGAPDRCT